MALSVQQVLNDAKKLASRLKDYDHNTDSLLAKAQNLQKTVETMKEVMIGSVVYMACVMDDN